MDNSLKLFKATPIILAGIIFGNVALGSSGIVTNAEDSLSMPSMQMATARTLYNAGTKKLLAGKLDDAESLLEASVTRQEDQVQTPALFNLGHVRFAQGMELLKKMPDGKTTTRRTLSAAAEGTAAIQEAKDALANKEVQQMVNAYIAGRGVRKEMSAAMKAVQRALEAHGKTLLKWQRSLNDFQSAVELNPADTNAAHNAEVVERAIARLVDSIQAMQQAAGPLAGKQAELNGLLKMLKGQIPAPNMPPGASGEEEGDEGDDGKKPSPESLSGKEESDKVGGGQEMGLHISPEQAGQIMNGIQPDGKQLPMGMGQGEMGAPKNRSGRIW